MKAQDILSPINRIEGEYPREVDNYEDRNAISTRAKAINRMLITWRVCAKLPHEPIIILKYRVSPTFGNGGLKCLDKIDANPRENHLPFLRNVHIAVLTKSERKRNRKIAHTPILILSHFYSPYLIMQFLHNILCDITIIHREIFYMDFYWSQHEVKISK